MRKPAPDLVTNLFTALEFTKLLERFGGAVDVTADSHPFWTGTQRLVDTAGRVEKFNRRYGKRAG